MLWFEARTDTSIACALASRVRVSMMRGSIRPDVVSPIGADDRSMFG
jgi:hypothetical protein